MRNEIKRIIFKEFFDVIPIHDNLIYFDKHFFILIFNNILHLLDYDVDCKEISNIQGNLKKIELLIDKLSMSDSILLFLSLSKIMKTQEIKKYSKETH